MPTPYSVDEFADKVDSLYRLVIVAARRANQIAKNEAHGFAPASSKKPTTSALDEVLEGKVGWTTTDDEDEFIE